MWRKQGAAGTAQKIVRKDEQLCHSEGRDSGISPGTSNTRMPFKLIGATYKAKSEMPRFADLSQILMKSPGFKLSLCKYRRQGSTRKEQD